MVLTPDHDLTLAFSSDLIPKDLHAALPKGYHLRPLSSTDYSRSHLDVLTVLTSTPDTGSTKWTETFDFFKSCPNTYYPIVIVEEEDDVVVATGMVFLERKFIRNCGTVGHIEDIAVGKKCQGKGIGKVIIQVLTSLSESLGAYKTILDCDPKNEAFYVKCGYENKGFEMAKYQVAPSEPTKSAEKI